MTQVAASTNNIDTMKSQYKRFIAALWHDESPDNEQAKMLEYYMAEVRHMRPQLVARDDGMLEVRGIT